MRLADLLVEVFSRVAEGCEHDSLAVCLALLLRQEFHEAFQLGILDFAGLELRLEVGKVAVELVKRLHIVFQVFAEVLNALHLREVNGSVPKCEIFLFRIVTFLAIRDGDVD